MGAKSYMHSRFSDSLSRLSVIWRYNYYWLMQNAVVQFSLENITVLLKFISKFVKWLVDIRQLCLLFKEEWMKIILPTYSGGRWFGKVNIKINEKVISQVLNCVSKSSYVINTVYQLQIQKPEYKTCMPDGSKNINKCTL